MADRTGIATAHGIADEIDKHRHRPEARHFSLPPNAEQDRDRLVEALWSDMSRAGPLWTNVRVFHDGRDLHPSRFMHGEISPGLVVHSTVDMAAVEHWLRDGATLIYNHLHETSYPVQRIQEILEYRLGAKVWIQAYVTKAGRTAFGRHRDDHNFVVLQLLGSKDWEVEAVGAEHTRRLLTAGDGAFLRSGTEHAVSGVGEISLHLTIAFDWCASTPEQPGSVLSADASAAHAAAQRLGTTLPVAIAPDLIGTGTVVRSASRVRPVVVDDGEHLELRCATGAFRFDRRLARVLDRVVEGTEVTVGELIAAAELPADQIVAFVRFALRKRVLLCGL